MKTRLASDGKTLLFWCPGCDALHGPEVNGDRRWTWNGDHEKPSISPSLLVRSAGEVCHSFITDGNIRFLGDCTHPFKGLTVEIPDWPYAPGEFGGVDDGDAV